MKRILKKEYDKYADIRYLIVNELKKTLDDLLAEINSNPVISVRLKNFESYFSKYLRMLKNGEKDPKITDILGIRIICPFIEDLSAAESLITKQFNIIETERKGHYSFKEFGYESTHILIKIPRELIERHGDPGTDIAEIQIRTILQDAWAEVEHELVYKVDFSPFDEPMKRKLAAVNASLSLADIIFQEIRSYQRKYSKEMDKRRETFFQKIEEFTDELLFDLEGANKNTQAQDSNEPPFGGAVSAEPDNESIDDLLVNALSAHNKNRFNEAIREYTRIMELKPEEIVCSIIYKHRGMAYFACSQYEKAVEDFSCALRLDPKSYKAAYYRGVVRSVLKDYLKAIEDYTLSLSINPYQSFCLFRRGQAYFHLSDMPAALADCEASLSLEPENESAVKFRELLLDKLKM